VPEDVRLNRRRSARSLNVGGAIEAIVSAAARIMTMLGAMQHPDVMPAEFIGRYLTLGCSFNSARIA
jgi:hypothetical protein